MLRAAQCGPTECQSAEMAHKEQLAFGRYRAARNLALIDILFATGIRVGETSSLNITDFFEAEGMFKIKGKGGRAHWLLQSMKKACKFKRSTYGPGYKSILRTLHFSSTHLGSDFPRKESQTSLLNCAERRESNDM